MTRASVKARPAIVRKLAARLCCALLALLAARASESKTNHGTPANTSTREGRLAVFEDAWQTVAERYYDPALHGADWPTLRERFREEAAGARDQTTLYGVLRRMLNELRDPHTRARAPSDAAPSWYATSFVSVGIVAREIGGQVLVASVERGSQAWRVGVKPGDAVSSVDGEDAPEVVARLEAAEAGAATPPRRARAVARLFDGPAESSASVIFLAPNGKAKRVSLRRTLRRATPSLAARRVGRDGYVRFNSFAPGIAGELARAMRETLRGARGLVIDLRDNGGGDSEVMADVASLFLPAGTPLGRFIDRAGRTQSEPHTRAALLTSAEAVTQFAGPLVVLTNARTASAAEIFAAALRERGRAQIVGEATCGCALGVRRRHTLPDGGTLEVSETDSRTASGVRLEAAGLKPDEQAAPTREDLRARRDPALERALILLLARRAATL